MQEETIQEDLLYDILVYHEWPQSQDPRSHSITGDNDNQIAINNQQSWFSTLAKWSASAKVTGGTSDPPSEVLNLIQACPSWKFSLSTDGSLLAVLQDSQLEFYSSKDNYSKSLAKVSLNRDPSPHLRVVEWSPDSSLLVITSSNGAVDLYDAYGFLVYSIFSQRLPQNEVATNEEMTGGIQTRGYAYAAAIFCDSRVKSRDWLYELILVDFRGTINSFLLSPSGYQEFTSFRLSKHYSFGVTSVSFCTKHNILCVTGPISQQQNNNQTAEHGPSKYGLTVWRLLNEAPHFDLVLPHDYTENSSYRWRGFLGGVTSKLPTQDHIFKIEESPNGEYISALHVSGKISVWRLPGLHLVKFWHLEEQPCHDDMNPALMQNPRLKRRKKQFLLQDIKWHGLDVKWWNDISLVISRYSGGVTILQLNDPDRNLLGESAEFFSGPSRLSKSFGKGFFVLEREVSTRKHKPQDSMDESFERQSSDDGDDDEDEASVFVRGKRMAASIAYLVTESDRFAPPRKKPKISYHSYKLLALISTTPEELYNRKIELEEYGEALILAQHYNLDSDQVYERQWKMSNLTTTAISDYLTKVKRRSLVLRECLHTVPNDVDAIRALLEYGLKETDLVVLEMMSRDDNEGRMIKPRNEMFSGITYDDYYLSEEELENRKKQEERRMINSIDWNNLSVNQKDLLAQRYVLIKYLDRLECYIEIVDRYQRYSKDVYFEKDFYIKFRDQPILEATVKFAHEGKSRAVATLLERYPQDLEDYRLCILSNFPESLSPDEYTDLIPSVDDLLDDQTDVEDMEDDPDLEKDWIHQESILEKVPAHVKQLDLVNLPFSQYKTQRLTRQELTDWIHERAKHIEHESSLVDHALSLLQHVSQYCGIVIDMRLYHQLTTLETMLYDIQSLTIITLDQMNQMSDLEILIKLMESSTKDTIVSDVRKFLIPYLDRLDQLEPGARKNLLQNYLLHSATTSLVIPYEIIKNSQTSNTISVFMSFDECVNLGLDCIYAYETDDPESDENDLIVELAQFLKKKCRNPHVLEEIEDILDIMRAIKLLKRYHINKTLHFFKACRRDLKAMQDLFIQVARKAEGKKPRLNPREWSEVLQDLFELKRLIPVVSLLLCIEVLCESLLCSEENINLVKDIFDYKPADALFKTNKSAMLYVLSVYKISHLPLESKEKIVSTACEYFLDSAKDVDDPNLEQAKRCLDLVKEESPKLQKYYDLLTALSMLHEFGISMLPIVLRNTVNFVPIVQKILNLDPASNYKNARKILRMIRLVKNNNHQNNSDNNIKLVKSIEDNDDAPLLKLIADFAIQASDYDYCLSICDMMMSTPSPEACQVCLSLVHCQDFSDTIAKSKLASFCVNFCDSEDIEEMLVQRIDLSDELPEIDLNTKKISSKKSVIINDSDPSNNETSDTAEPVVEVKNALSKLTESANDPVQMIPNIPEASTKVISSLFGKLSKFNPMLGSSSAPNSDDDNENMMADKDCDLPNINSALAVSPSKKAKQIAVNAFYEDVFDRHCRIGRLQSCFENFSESIKSGPLDKTTLTLLSRHYRNALELELDDQIEWSVLKDILYILMEEDTSLAVSLMISELPNVQHHVELIDELVQNPKRLPLGIYLVTLRSALDFVQDRKMFHVNPGVLYACMKTLHSQGLFKNELFENVIDKMNCDDYNDDD